MTQQITENSSLLVNFKLRFDDGTDVDSNEGLEPIRLDLGSGILLPALEEKLIGLKAGDQIQVTLPPEDAYGFANPNEIVKVPVSDLPPDVKAVGDSLVAEDDYGEQKIVLVSEINKKTATLDFNHPYAGRTLVFDIDVLEIIK